ncbi:MAG TPA: DoxX family protein [Flavobacterium sp.]|jgi:uncharacterized membrane protein YphA (DoxX/SURF4 family)
MRNFNFEQIHAGYKRNKWLRYFTTFCRVGLAWGFLPSGFVKINGERFTALADNHPMGAYLEALHHTGYYYTFIGIAQMTAAVLLLIPRTATLGAMLYLPIILNICILSLAVGFDGSLLTSPLMVIANLYLLCWDYDRLKFALPFHRPQPIPKESLDTKFPIKFFALSAVAVVAIVVTILSSYTIRPRNTYSDCSGDCDTAPNPQACYDFCNCIHKDGHTYDDCTKIYKKAIGK